MKKRIRDFKFLIVDDSFTIRKIVTSNLQKIGAVNILQAKDVKEALSALINNRIDIVVTDHNMPGMTGLELIARSKKIPHAKETVFVLLSSEFTEHLLDQYEQLGIEYYLRKPFDAQSFNDVLAPIFGDDSDWEKPSINELATVLKGSDLSIEIDEKAAMVTFKQGEYKLEIDAKILYDNGRLFVPKQN